MQTSSIQFSLIHFCISSYSSLPFFPCSAKIIKWKIFFIHCHISRYSSLPFFLWSVQTSIIQLRLIIAPYLASILCLSSPYLHKLEDGSSSSVIAAYLASFLWLSSPDLCKQASSSWASFIATYIDSIVFLSSPDMWKLSYARSYSVISASLAILLCLSCEAFCNQADASS